MDDVMILVRFSNDAVGITGWGLFWFLLVLFAVASNGSK